MESSFSVQLVCPSDVREFEGILSATFFSKIGSIGILPNHADVIGEIEMGCLLLNADGSNEGFAISGGFFEVRDNKLYIVADTVEEGRSIDVVRAREARERAEELIKQKNGVDMIRAEAALMRALNRLRAAGKNG